MYVWHLVLYWGVDICCLQLGKIYLDMLNVYKCLSENISQAVTLHGELFQSILAHACEWYGYRKPCNQAATNSQHASGKERNTKADFLLGVSQPGPSHGKG